MIINRERDVCFGRSFASGHVDLGFWENFYNWIERASVAVPTSKATGGPGWHIIDDQSAASPDPYIVISNHTLAEILAEPNKYDVPHKILKCGFNITEAGIMRIEAYLYWDGVAHVGYGRWACKWLNDYDSAQFVYDFRGGPEMLCISSRLGVDWDSFFFADWEGDANLVDGKHVVGTLQAGITAGAHVVLQLNAGQAADFTEGHYAFLIDMDGHTWCNYVLIEDVDAYTDQITIDACNQNFPQGSIIGAYPHRFCITSDASFYIGSQVGGWYTVDSYAGVQIPYVSVYGNEMNLGGVGNAIYQYAMGDVLRYVIGSGTTLPVVPGMSPNDRGQYACQRPVIMEQYGHLSHSTGMNRGYGPVKNAWATCQNNLLQMTDGRRINNLNHVYFLGSSDCRMGEGSQVLLVPDYDSIV
jgi:hypothetical protein